MGRATEVEEVTLGLRGLRERFLAVTATLLLSMAAKVCGKDGYCCRFVAPSYLFFWEGLLLLPSSPL